MRRLLAWLAAALGGVAVYRLLTRDRAPAVESAPEAPAVDPRAEELRRRLEESRAVVDERDAFEEGETTVDRADAGAPPDERRRDVHERGRAAVDEMRSGVAEGSAQTRRAADVDSPGRPPEAP